MNNDPSALGGCRKE